MGDDRYEQGWERLRELAGEHGERVIEGVRDVSPDLARYVVEFGYGDMSLEGAGMWRAAWFERGSQWHQAELRPEPWSSEEQLAHLPERAR